MSEGLCAFLGMMLIHHRGAKAEHEEKALMMCAFPPKGQKKPQTKQNKKKKQEVILRCLCRKNAQRCAEAAAAKAIRGKISQVQRGDTVGRYHISRGAKGTVSVKGHGAQGRIAIRMWMRQLP